MSGSTFFTGSNLEIWIWPDWGYTTWADLAGVGSIGLIDEWFM